MLRHSHNKNLTLHTDSQYAGLPVNVKQGPLISQYLERILQVTHLALDQHARTFAFRVDLRFPQNHSGVELESNLAMERFMASFKAKIRANREQALQRNSRLHDSAMRYIWCREYGAESQSPHYHCVIFLNHDAFCSLGKYRLGADNLFNALHQAWASALRIPVQQASGLVHIPHAGSWCLKRGDTPTLCAFFAQVSYLAKAHTKHYFQCMHMFGSSRG